MNMVERGAGQAAIEAITNEAREMARSGDFCSWRLIEIELRFMRGIREAAGCFTDPELRDELDRLCRQARPAEEIVISRPAIAPSRPAVPAEPPAAEAAAKSPPAGAAQLTPPVRAAPPPPLAARPDESPPAQTPPPAGLPREPARALPAAAARSTAFRRRPAVADSHGPKKYRPL